MNELDLTRILKSEIFVHTDEQLRAAYVILGYTSISRSFQAPKYVFKAKNPRLHQINIVVLGFLSGLPPASAKPVELFVQRAPKEEATLSHPIPEQEVTKIIEVVDFKEDFDVFDHSSPIESPCASSVYLPFAQVSSIQESSDIPDAMVL